jgi:hypothetical protein
MFGRELLLQGVHWAIGDRRSVKITSGNWIADRPPYMACPLKEIPNVAMVHCILDEHTRSWIPETIYAFFDRETADQIMEIHISQDWGDFIF